MKKNYKVAGIWASILFSFCLLANASDPESIYFWKFTSEPIYSKPIIHDSIIYFGTDGGKLYAININNGKEIWHYTAANSNSFPAIKDSIIVFEAKNKLYALHALTGKLFWTFTTNENAENSLGTTDYHHSSPVIADSLVIFCDQSGYINGIDIETGDLKYQFLTDGHFAIRGTPAIKDSIVYAGDWEGNIYAVSLKDSLQIWKHTMQNTRPYYGAVVSEMVIKDDVLYFGSQHDVYSPLNIYTGEPVWTYIDPRATYLPPTPVFYEDKIIIGTTINANQIMCFKNDTDHELMWNFNASGIFFTTPVIKDSILIMNSCNFDYATGHMYFLNCKNGNLMRQMEFTNTGPFIPVLKDSILFIGTNNGLYAAGINAIMQGKGSQIILNTNSEEYSYYQNAGKKRIIVNVGNNGNVCDSIYLELEVTENTDKIGFLFQQTKKLQGKILIPPYFQVFTDSLPVGIYHLTVKVHAQNEPKLNLTKQITIAINEKESDINLGELKIESVIYPNPASESITIKISGNDIARCELSIYNCNGSLVIHESVPFLNQNNEYTWDLNDSKGNKAAKGDYFCIIKSGNQVLNKKLIIF